MISSPNFGNLIISLLLLKHRTEHLRMTTFWLKSRRSTDNLFLTAQKKIFNFGLIYIDILLPQERQKLSHSPKLQIKL